MRGGKKSAGALWAGTAALLAAGVLWLSTATDRLDAGRDAEGQSQLEDAIRRSVVACYATEGIYPPTLEYLEEHYGLQVDRDRYTVFYDAFASNLMPDVTVLSNRETEEPAV